MRLCQSVLLTGVAAAALAAAGCGASGQDAQPPPPRTDGKIYQYRAVCQEKDAHGGNVQVLSRWLEARDKAEALGKYHGDFKDKGHRWRIEERVRPEPAGSPQSK
jgi:hypothetical protein